MGLRSKLANAKVRRHRPATYARVSNDIRIKEA